MRFLIIGRGTGSAKVAGHELDFKEKAFVLIAKRETRILNLADYHYVLQHIGNVETLDALKEWKNQGEIQKVVGITAGVGRVENAFCIEKLGLYTLPVLKGIHSKDDVLNLRWVDLNEGIRLDSFALAEVLQPKPIGMDNLIAILILCQGYLAAHAEKENGKWGPTQILSGLKQMGWLDFMDGPGKSILQIDDLEVRKSEVCRAGWWLEPFEVWKDNRIVPDKLKKFEESVKKEWGKDTTSLPEEVAGLLSALRNGDDVGEPQIVADAYCVIVERLGGTRCNGH